VPAPEKDRPVEKTPPTPDPSDHQGPSTYEGWDPTPDPLGELDIPGASGTSSSAGSGIAFIPGDPATASGAPDANLNATADDEVTALRERLAFYETFDSLIRDNIDRAGALMREVATRQVDAEAKLRTSSRDFERRQIDERTGYRKVFASLLDEVSTIQQQVERLARQVSDALDDLELQLPAAGELTAIERGQAPGMSGLAGSISTPAGLPSGASSAAWVTHDDDLPASTGKHATTSTHQPPAEADPEPDSGKDEPLTSDDMDVVQDAVGEVDAEVVEDVLTEGTDADPEVADSADDQPGSISVTDMSDLPEEFGLDSPGVAGTAGVIDEPYAEQSSASAGDTGGGDADPLDDRLTAAAESEGFSVDSAPALDDRDNDGEDDATPLQQSAPAQVDDIDGGLDEEPAPDDAAGANEAADAAAGEVASVTDPSEPYGSDAPAETGIGGGGTSLPGLDSGPSGNGEPRSKLRRFEPEAPRPVWGSVPPAPRIDPPRVSTQPAFEQGEATVAQDTIVLVHGVPRATTALSLKRYLEGLEAVTAVEPREYAEGVLRLQVTGERAIRITDLSAWPDGSGLQEVQLREDLVEIRLPG